MRSAVMILALLLVLGGVFYFVILRDRPSLYVDQASTRPQGDPTSRRIVPASVPTTGEGSVLGRTERGKFEVLDRDGRLAREFQFERIDPRKDDAVDVTLPRVWFHNADGSLITLEGTNGTVAYSQTGGRADPAAVGSATPTSGVLENVVIRLFERKGDVDPTLTATVPKIQFDATDNRLSTVDSIIDGRGVLGEQVPVRVRGRDYEFDGRGLTLRWNDRDGRLEQLQIRHGERLLLRDVRKLSGGRDFAVVTDPEPEPEARLSAFSPRSLFTGIIAAEPTTRSRRAAQQRRAAAAERAATSRPARTETLYHARFAQGVEVYRSGVPIAVAETMNVVLPLGEDRRSRTGGEPPEPSTRRLNPRPATRLTDRGAKASTQPAETLEVRWSGPLDVRPADATIAPARGGKMIEFIGEPARVMQGAGSIEARLVHVEPDAGLARIEPGGSVKTISLNAGDGVTLESRSALLVDREAGVAVIDGPGTLTATDAGRGAEVAPTTASWNRRLELRLSNFGDDPQAPQWLEQVTLEGEAAIEAEGFAMNGEALSFGFDEPDALPREDPTSPTAGAIIASPSVRFLRLASATGHARVEVGDATDRQTLVGNQIQLGLEPSGESAALTSILGDGDVAMLDAAGSEFYAQHLDVAVRPIALASAATRPSTGAAVTPGKAELKALDWVERLNANGSVRLKQPDGTLAEGEALSLSGEGAAKRARLTGSPAKAGNAQAMLTAEELELDPATSDARVRGGGELLSRDPALPAARSAMRWKESLVFTSADGTVDVRGGVVIERDDGHGSTLAANADRSLVALSHTAVTTRPATNPSAAPAFDSVRSVTLDGNVLAKLGSADGRDGQLETSILGIDVAHNLVTADRPGRMRMENRPAASTQPATPAVATTRPTLPAAAMAVEWQERLRWDLANGDLSMNGGIRIGYARDDLGETIRIAARELQAKLTPVDLNASARRDKPTAPVELRSVSVIGNVAVRSTRAKFDAAMLRYDLSSDLAYASGDEQRDVTVIDANNTSSVGFSRITWNVRTGAIEDFRDIRGRVRR